MEGGRSEKIYINSCKGELNEKVHARQETLENANTLVWEMLTKKIIATTPPPPPPITLLMAFP